MGWDLILKNWLRTGTSWYDPSVTSWRIACGQGEDRFQLAGSLSDTMLRRSTFQSNKSTQIFLVAKKQREQGFWMFTHIRLIRLWILHDFTLSCQVHQRLWIPGKVPPRWGFYGPPWDSRRCLMEKTCDDNRWCQMTQCWWRSFQILVKNSTIFGMLSIWECEKSEPSLSHVRFSVGDCPNRPALPWLEFCWYCDCNLLQHCSCWSGSIRRARHAGRLAWA